MYETACMIYSKAPSPFTFHSAPERLAQKQSTSYSFPFNLDFGNGVVYSQPLPIESVDKP